MERLTSRQLREAFIDYFKRNGHEHVPPGPLVPRGDSSLLFTSAGMVQFKDKFLAPDTAHSRRVVTSQPCLRVGGKHNDFEQVGHTARHHTLFEMLGNFSFGDVSKADAIALAWSFLTETLRLPKERLSVSVFAGDEDAARIWRCHHGLPDGRIARLGTRDNFWVMGDGPGPCGPCTEIFWHHNDAAFDGERQVEIWNVVFMELLNAARGDAPPGESPDEAEKAECARLSTLPRLPRLSVDTGMGLERLASVLQGKTSNYDIDSMRALIARAESATRTIYREGSNDASSIALRVLADHARALAFLVADGVAPSATAHGYVARRIVRRAVLYAHSIGATEPLLAQLAVDGAREFADAYPSLALAEPAIRAIISAEELQFADTLSRGRAELERFLAANPGLRALPPAEHFRLRDTHGLPREVTAMLAAQRGLAVDNAAVDALVREQQERSRVDQAGGGGSASAPRLAPSTDQGGADGRPLEPVAALAERWLRAGLRSRFVGYTETNATAHVLASAPADSAGSTFWLALDASPLYAEAGGQVADQGRVLLSLSQTRVAELTVTAVARHGKANAADGELLLVAVSTAELTPDERAALARANGLPARVLVDESARRRTSQHHTATHLLHAALRARFGDGVTQAGSHVGPERLRFDFRYRGPPLQTADLEALELAVNQVAARNTQLRTREMPLADAQREGAMALFGEKYGEHVRVVTVPDASVELCGGTHVARTGELAPVVILAQSGIGAGTRRIEALAGDAARAMLVASYAETRRLAGELQTSPAGLSAHIRGIVAKSKAAAKELKSLRAGARPTSTPSAAGEPAATRG